MTRVLGIDLSLTGTGLAGNGWADTITPPPAPSRNAAWRRLTPDEQRHATVEYRHRRLAFVLAQIRDRYITTAPDLVVLEGLSYDSYDTERQLAGLAWSVRHSLWRLGIAYATVPPSCLKQFATDNGAADKDAVRAAVGAWFDWFDGDHNAADAAVLMAMGYEALETPLIRPLSVAQASAVAKSQWPDLEPLQARRAAQLGGTVPQGPRGPFHDERLPEGTDIVTVPDVRDWPPTPAETTNLIGGL